MLKNSIANSKMAVGSLTPLLRLPTQVITVPIRRGNRNKSETLVWKEPALNCTDLVATHASSDRQGSRFQNTYNPRNKKPNNTRLASPPTASWTALKACNASGTGYAILSGRWKKVSTTARLSTTLVSTIKTEAEPRSANAAPTK